MKEMNPASAVSLFFQQSNTVERITNPYKGHETQYLLKPFFFFFLEIRKALLLVLTCGAV